MSDKENTPVTAQPSAQDMAPSCPPPPSAEETPELASDPAMAHDEAVAAGLSDALRSMYDSVVDEPLPASFANLLAQLDDDDA